MRAHLKDEMRLNREDGKEMTVALEEDPITVRRGGCRWPAQRGRRAEWLEGHQGHCPAVRERRTVGRRLTARRAEANDHPATDSRGVWSCGGTGGGGGSGSGGGGGGDIKEARVLHTEAHRWRQAKASTPCGLSVAIAPATIKY